MDRRYPPEVVALLQSVERARLRLRQEIERSRELLRLIEEQMQLQGGRGRSSPTNC